MANPLGSIADGEEVLLIANGQRWLNSWHYSTTPPEGRAHGSAGICLTASGDVVLISEDGARWDLPAGRPEPGETWEDVLRREVWEEACARVTAARLLGFARGRCIEGNEKGIVLVRAFWLAEVELKPWKPAFEITHRTLVPATQAVEHINIEAGYIPTVRRAFAEAGLSQS